MRKGEGTPLKERLEAASDELAMTYRLKGRLARAGVHPYDNGEFFEDLCRVAKEHGLLARALLAYFRVVHDFRLPP